MRRVDFTFPSQNDSSFEDVPEFANVPGPVVPLQCLEGSGLDGGDLGFMTAVQIGNDRLAQRRQVLQPVSQRRQREMQYAQAEEQILAKATRSHQGLEV